MDCGLWIVGCDDEGEGEVLLVLVLSVKWGFLGVRSRKDGL